MSAVLAIRPSSLGDIVHALAIVADIRRHHPGLAIDWVAEEAFVPLVALEPGVRRVIPVALRRWRHALLAAATWREYAAFRRALRQTRYAAILDMQEQLKGALIAASAIGRKHGPDRASIREPIATLMHDAHHAIDPRQHLVDRCRQLAAAALGHVADGPPRYGLVAPAAPAGLVSPGERTVIFVHATSRPAKLWPDAHWRTLMRPLARAGYVVLLPWGNAQEHARSLALARGEPAARVLPSLSLPALAGLIAGASLVVGVDTGLVHLAAAQGTPTVALFTATDPVLAGVERTSTSARDLGDKGRTPEVAEVRAVAEALLQHVLHG